MNQNLVILEISGIAIKLMIEEFKSGLSILALGAPNTKSKPEQQINIFTLKAKRPYRQ